MQQPGETPDLGRCQWNELKPWSLGLSISQQGAKDVHVQTEGSPSTGAREGQSGQLSSFLCMLPVVSWFPWKLAAAEMMLGKLLPRFKANRFALLRREQRDSSLSGPACGVKAVSEKLQVPQDSLHHLPRVTDSLCSPKSQPEEKGRRRRWRRKEQRL